MNIELFDKGVEFIASRNDKQLNLGNWQSSYIALSSEYVNCGTIACAAGWLALNPEFEALGVRASRFGAPRFDGFVGYDAMAKLFGISQDDARTLFHFRAFEDKEVFGDLAEEHMTDRQLWLSRARLIRAKYAETVSRKFRRKPDEVEAYTFKEVVQAGVESGAPLVRGMPWSFQFKGYPVTHERDDWYLIQLENGSADLMHNRMLVVGQGGSYVCTKELFEATYEKV
jgi:hypothetical protein